jgi:hypothetical protein
MAIVTNVSTPKPGKMKKALISRSLVSLLGMIAILLATVYGCRNAQQKQEAAEAPAGLVSPGEDIEALAGYPLPSSYEVTDLIYAAGAPYILTLSNDPQKAQDYITQRDKALNLGVYGADLCYASTYMMKQRTMFFLEASKTLVDELGISTSFNMNYAERVENNLDDRDSLMRIVEDSFFDTWDHLINNKQDILARLVVSGSWIEGMYITTNVAQSSRDNTTFMEILANQSNSLNKLVSLLEPVKDVNEISMIYQSLVELQGIYEGVGESLTDKQLETISDKVKELRNTIV